MTERTAVHFGAGNIGRGFIGQLLRASGYRVTFVDVNADAIRLLNELQRYPVYVVDQDGTEEQWVEGVSGLMSTDRNAVVAALAQADLVTTAVGKSVLPHVAPLIAEGLRRRRDPVPIVVVACENALGNSSHLAELVAAHAEDASILDAGRFPDCMVDRIVPNMRPTADAHPLAVTVERYFHWAIDARDLPELPPLVGVEFTSDLDAVLAQKLFTLNMAHAIAGYYGYRHGATYIHEAMAHDGIRLLMQGAMREAGTVLTDVYGISPDDQSRYAAQVICRLENPALRDTVIRVAREPSRKLGATDRLVQPALQSCKQGHVPAHLSTGIAAALAFDAPEDADARDLHALVTDLGIKNALSRVSGIAPDHVIAELVEAHAAYASL